MSTCGCCHWFYKSNVVARGTSNNAAYTRKCIASKKKVMSDNDRCKYFNPEYFYCDKFGVRLKYVQCLARRRNEKKLREWDVCKRCRQFEKEIADVIKDYFLEMVPIVTPRRLQGNVDNSGNTADPTMSYSFTSEKRIKRRKKKSEGSGKIKRRKKSNSSTKVIKRRKKEDKEDKVRKIKRRSK